MPSSFDHNLTGVPLPNYHAVSQTTADVSGRRRRVAIFDDPDLCRPSDARRLGVP